MIRPALAKFLNAPPCGARLDDLPSLEPGLVALVFASPGSLQLLAATGDLDSLSLDTETEFFADFVFKLLQLITFELHNSLTIIADQMIVVGMIRVVWIVKAVFLPKIHLFHQPTFC